jgi:histidinol phosphatase-like PHP family hydrolase
MTVLLFDAHVHTELASCAEDITAAAAFARFRELGLGFGFSEHADQLYFPREDYFEKYEIQSGSVAAMREFSRAGHSRFRRYRELVAPFAAQGVPAGIEAEAAEDSAGLGVLEEDLSGWDYLIGAVHEFRSMADRGRTEPMADLERDFMLQTEKLCRAGVKVYAHPFRIFGRRGRDVPKHLYRPVAEMLAAHGVAAEINFHTNRPDPEFFALCLDLGVKLSVGSDSHAMHEVGALEKHAGLLQELGVAGRLEAVMWRPTADW